MFAGQVTVGFCVSLTLTVNEHCAVLPLLSVTVQVTVVVPTLNDEPDAGRQVGVRLPSQSSEPAVLKLTVAEHSPVALLTVTFAGQATIGAAFGVTLT
jgi:hypothetical protein